jgi:hypothetical protein
MKHHFPALFLALLALCAPAAARLWKPTPEQEAQDYSTITHNKGPDGRVVLSWMSSASMSSPVMQQLLDKYLVLSVVHTRSGPGGTTSWDEVQGVQVMDAGGAALKELSGDAIPPTLVGMIATVEAVMKQNSHGQANGHWSVYDAGAVHACGPGKLQVAYGGETYTWDTPLPGCPKK